MPNYFVYVLESLDNRYYVGYTTNLTHRMKEHRTGKGAKFTRGFGFRKLLYYELLLTKSAALKREAEIKRLSHAEKKSMCKLGN